MSSWKDWVSNEGNVPAVTLGEVLAAKRGERGLTIEQASTATSIRAHYLSALESNELERRVSLVYAKGHLTTYARYLGLDPDPLVRLLRSEGTPATGTARLALLPERLRAYAWRKLHPR